MFFLFVTDFDVQQSALRCKRWCAFVFGQIFGCLKTAKMPLKFKALAAFYGLGLRCMLSCVGLCLARLVVHRRAVLFGKNGLSNMLYIGSGYGFVFRQFVVYIVYVAQ